MDPGEAQILTVQRLDDGVIYQRALQDGMRAETYYKPIAGEPVELETFLESRPSSDAETETPPSPGKTRVTQKLGFILFALFFHLLLFLVWAVIVDPFFVAKIPQLAPGSQSARDQLPRDVIWEKLGCERGPFCQHYSAPVIITPAGTFYPNFTRDDGEPIDFLAVLSGALGVMANESCSGDFKLTLFEGKKVPVDYGAEFLHTVTWYMEKSKMLLSHNCHPEISYMLDSGYRYKRFGEDRVLSLWKSPPPGPCGVNWTDLYGRPSRRPVKRRTLCAGDMLGSVGALNPLFLNQIKFS